MPYAEGRVYNDADAHVMEPVNWLNEYADAKTRTLLKPVDYSRTGKMAEHALKGKQTEEHWKKVDIENNLMFLKGWAALGAFDPSERKRAMDMLGFNKQLVFSSIAASQFWGLFAQTQYDLDLLYGGARALNRAITDFCKEDNRLIPVGFLPLDDARRAEKEIDEGLKLGCGTFWIPAKHAGDKSPTHRDYDGVWARLQDANVPFMLHVGAGETPVAREYRNNGRPMTDFLGGGENLDSKAFMLLHAPAEAFLSAMVLDGTLEQFPRLRGGVIEMGALWVPPWLRRLDVAQGAFGRTEPTLAGLKMKPSDYVRRQLKFTPHPTEPVRWIVEQGGEELFLFSSDYPHIEGGRNPIKRFNESMDGLSASAFERFYATNFTEMMGG
ncbi:MAG TPA: amidohydrolase family protein [Candidatus Binataceae bacterium]|nr:amidohydrolase family protein [Candidatus Binataceae bacterium]